MAKKTKIKYEPEKIYTVIAKRYLPKKVKVMRRDMPGKEVEAFISKSLEMATYYWVEEKFINKPEI